MGKLQVFLMSWADFGDELVEVRTATLPDPFLVRAITEGENKAIRKSCKKVIIDQKTRQRQEYTDQDLYNNKLVVACCVEPNFKDAEWQAAKGVMGAEALLDKVLTAGEFSDLLMGVLRVNGFDDDINDLVDEAKN